MMWLDFHPNASKSISRQKSRSLSDFLSTDLEIPGAATPIGHAFRRDGRAIK
jgi:hypothetical protein